MHWLSKLYQNLCGKDKNQLKKHRTSMQKQKNNDPFIPLENLFREINYHMIAIHLIFLSNSSKIGIHAVSTTYLRRIRPNITEIFKIIRVKRKIR